MRPATVLPVTLTSIKAYKKNTGVQVDWSVANESGLVRYEVERSGDGSRFYPLGSISASSQGQYNYFDPTPARPDNFYRVKYFTTAGDVFYTKVAKVHFSNGDPIFTVFPNPVTNGQFSVVVNGAINSSLILKLASSTGAVVYTSSFKSAGVGTTQKVQLGTKPAKGVYTLTLWNGADLIGTQQVNID
jgi:hypothetical protein